MRRSAECAYVSEDDNNLGLVAIRVILHRTRRVAVISRRIRIERGYACGPITPIPHPKEKR